MKIWLALALLSVPAVARVQTNGLVRGTRPPVIFLNGYQLNCDTATLQSAFGRIGEFLTAQGVSTGFFDSCQCRNCPIEQLGEILRQDLEELRYTDGGSVDQVDVVAHSLGGLVLRSYLSGKQVEPGVFRPPLEPRVHRAVFLATPNFGTNFAFAVDTQARQMRVASRFVYELASWNQGGEDLRGVDAVAAAGNAGTLGGPGRGSSDGVVSLVSASIGFARGDERTRVIPACHTSIPILCQAGAPGIAEMDSADQASARIVLSFLAGTSEWRGVGTTPAGNEYLSRLGGLMVASDGAGAASWNGTALVRSADGVWHSEWLASGEGILRLDAAEFPYTLRSGAGWVAENRTGSAIAGVLPSAARLPYWSVAPGSLISIYGSGLGNAPIAVNGRTLEVNFVSDAQVNARMPDDVLGLVRLTAAARGVNVMVEPVAPAVFTRDGSGTGDAAAVNAVTGMLITPDSPVRRGEIVSLFATGLGATERRESLEWAIRPPVVWMGGVAAQVLYAGRSPEYPGLDQINVVVPAGVSANLRTDVRVDSSRRQSNLVSLAVQ